MSLSSTSSLAEIEAAYVDNGDYFVVGSIEMAQTFAKACRLLLLRVPAESNEREGGYRLDLAAVKKDADAVAIWLASNASAAPAGGSDESTTRVVSFRNFRT